VGDGGTQRRCAGLLNAQLCIPTDDNHVCTSDYCNASSRPYTGKLPALAAAIFVVAAVVANVR